MSSKPLPSFRQDLRMFRGPDEPDGSPSYTLYDPVRGEYFKISWMQLKVIKLLQPNMTLDDLHETLAAHTTLNMSKHEIVDFFNQAAAQGLLDIPRDSESIEAEARRQRTGLFQNILLNYLFFKIPLWNPDAFLERTLGHIKPLLTRSALYCYLLIIIWGAAAVVLRWDEFLGTFSYFFSVQGIVFYGLCIAFTKTIHELAHAYTAKKYGLRVPTMGIAFLLLFPVLYTDVTDAWRLSSRLNRLIISAAGVIVELALAGAASIAWAYSSPGILQSLFFVLASANWLNTLAINLNPAMRFDGYYLLSDLLGIDNLQQRAFALARTAAYRVFLGAALPDPEPDLPSRWRRWLIIYAVYTFCYRLFLYTAIALFVYFKFTKVLGVFLFGVEVLIFFLWPIFDEYRFYTKVRKQITLNWQAAVTGTIVLLSFLWLCFPLPHHYSFAAITIPVHDQLIYAPHAGKIIEVPQARGQRIKPGDLLISIQSAELDNQISQKEKEREILKRQLAVSETDLQLHSFISEKEASLRRLEAEINGLKEQSAQNTVRSSIDGFVYEWDDLIHPGQYIAKDQVIGKIAVHDQIEVLCFVPEGQIQELEIGQKAQFYSKRSRDRYNGRVSQIGPVRLANLEYRQLSSLNHGPLPVVKMGDGQLHLIESFYPVRVTLDSADVVKIGETGKVKITGPWRSLIVEWFQYLSSLLIQESNV